MVATRIGSAMSTVPGQPVLTLQYEHALVHVSPKIMNVAVPRSQHSPMFGQAASSQTVFRLAFLIFLRISRKFSPPGALTLNQSGNFRSTVGEPGFSDLETKVYCSIHIRGFEHSPFLPEATFSQLVQNNRQTEYFLQLLLIPDCLSYKVRFGHTEWQSINVDEDIAARILQGMWT